MQEIKGSTTLKQSIKDGLAIAAMNGLTSSFITPFAITLGSTSGVIALLSSLPELVGSFMELGANKLIKLVSSRRNILVSISTIQGIGLLFLTTVAIASMYTNVRSFIIPLLIGAVIFHSSLTHMQSPVWSSYMGDIVPEKIRGSFFGRRNRWIALTTFALTLVAGSVLSAFGKTSVIGFIILFFAAAVASFLAARFKGGMINIPYTPKNEIQFNGRDLLYNLNKTSFGNFILYQSAIKFAVNIANPFFALYMLTVLQFDYLTFTLIIAAPIIANFISLQYWGPVVDRFGTKRILQQTGICIFIIPLFWLINQNPLWLFIVEGFSGVIWAGFNLASSTYLLEAVKPENRVRCISWHNCFIGVAIFLGASLGGIILANNVSIWIYTGIPLILFLSVLMRIIPTILLLPRLKEMRLVEINVGDHNFFNPALTIYPSHSQRKFDTSPSIKTSAQTILTK